MAARVRKAQIAERRTKALAMRAAGQKWEDIAQACGYSTRAAACQDIRRLLDERLKEQDDQVDHLRAIEIEKLDAMQRRMEKIIASRDPEIAMKAADRLVKIGERRAKLLGIEAPVKIEQGGTLRYEIAGVDPDAHS
jgi:hypothetical protein